MDERWRRERCSTETVQPPVYGEGHLIERELDVRELNLVGRIERKKLNLVEVMNERIEITSTVRLTACNLGDVDL